MDWTAIPRTERQLREIAGRVSPIDQTMLEALDGELTILAVFIEHGLCVVDVGGMPCWCLLPYDWSDLSTGSLLH